MAKAVLLLCVLVGISPVAFVVWYCWDSSQNHGLPFGYYGEFNRVKHALTAIPGVTVTSDWANHDSDLEEFGFDITNSAGRAIHLFFAESDPTRDLSGDVLVRGLTNKIEFQAQLQNNGSLK